jgi:ribosome-associated heat shock protein Hsp15
MGVRLDKWLHVARIFKTRTLASKACSAGRVEVNGMPAKPHRPVVEQDRLEIEFQDWRRILIVRELHDKPIPRASARLLYEDLSPPRPKPDSLDSLLRRAPVVRPKGSGRPTKRERRELDLLTKKTP